MEDNHFKKVFYQLVEQRLENNSFKHPTMDEHLTDRGPVKFIDSVYTEGQMYVNAFFIEYIADTTNVLIDYGVKAKADGRESYLDKAKKVVIEYGRFLNYNGVPMQETHHGFKLYNARLGKQGYIEKLKVSFQNKPKPQTNYESVEISF